MKIQRFRQNTSGMDFVVGDIHGCFPLLEATLEKVNFDSSKDRLFSVGDLVDRGTNSESVLDWLGYTWFHAVLGNHEQMAIDAADGFYDRWDYTANGGKWFIDLGCPKRFAAAFSKLPLVIEVETKDGLVGIVHAEAPVKKWKDISTANPQSILWNRDRIHRKDISVIEGISKVYVGHTSVKEITILGNVHYIDTGAFHTEKLTIVQL